MTLIRFDKVSLEFGDTPLLREADFSLQAGERVCLIGRNGAGKSSMLRLITGQLQPDHGQIERMAEVEVSQLDQELAAGSERLARDVIADGLAHQKALIDRFQALSDGDLDPAQVRELESVQHQIEVHGGWQMDQQIDQVITRLKLPADQPMNELSGGWRRRVALGKALVSKPDLLLLDEPTNHLDISTIEWLEGEIRAFPGAVLLITHDRAFMQRLATRIVELDLGQLTSWDGDYHSFLRQKEQFLADEARHNALFDKKLAEEERWIRQGIKARRTRNEGRVRALEAMRKERAGRLERQGKANLKISGAEESGRKVIEARHLTHGFDGKTLLEDLSIKIMRGDRIGLVGNNGVGKSTLLRILLGELAPDKGTVKLGTKLEVAYFDQLRASLDGDRSVIENVGSGQDFVTINGKPRHVISYMADFLFSPGRARTPVRALSGGERNRVILAQLFCRPANLLVLDEPTNDLDVEMLEVLEARMVDFDGSLILVSHDREFLDNVVTSVLVFEEDGKVHEYVGGYSDWERRGRRLAVAEHPSVKQRSIEMKPASVPVQRPAKQAKLSYKLQRELDGMPDRIETLEQSIAEFHTRMNDPEFYAGAGEEVADTLARLAALEQELEAVMTRWSELEQM